MTSRLRTLLAVTLLAGACERPSTPAGSVQSAYVGGIESGILTLSVCPCSDVAAARAADGHVEVFVRSTADGSLWRLWESGGAYTATNVQRLTAPKFIIPGLPFRFVPAEAIGGAPAVMLDPSDGQLHVFFTLSTGELRRDRGQRRRAMDDEPRLARLRLL